jgi:3-oxoacyl-[acyl-carrier-protein] synthase-3
MSNTDLENTELFLHSIGYAHPKNKITNSFLIELGAETTEEWIKDKLGIDSRFSVLPPSYIHKTKNIDPSEAIDISEQTPTELAVQAAISAIEKAGISKDEIGMVICDCCYPNHVAPVESQRIATALQIQATAYDVLTACPAFALHVDFLRKFKSEALPEYILAITTSAFTQCVDYKDRTDPAIWGDGAAAVIFSPRKAGKLKVLHSFFDSDPTRNQAVVINRFSYFKQDGRAVRDFSVRQTVRMLKDLEKRFNLDWNKDVFIGHQANATMLRQITGNREIPEANHWHNAEDFGNQASAGAPIVLGMNWDRLQSGQKVVVAVLGAGLSWGSVVFEVGA